MSNQLLYSGAVDYLEVPDVGKYMSNENTKRTSEIPDGKHCDPEGILCCYAAKFRGGHCDCMKFIERMQGSIINSRLKVSSNGNIEKCKGCKKL